MRHTDQIPQNLLFAALALEFILANIPAEYFVIVWESMELSK